MHGTSSGMIVQVVVGAHVGGRVPDFSRVTGRQHHFGMAGVAAAMLVAGCLAAGVFLATDVAKALRQAQTTEEAPAVTPSIPATPGEHVS